MHESKLINKTEAEKIITEIEDPDRRFAINLLVKSLEEYFREEPTRLHGPFDLRFFVNVLKEWVDDISGLLRGTTQIEYWFEDYPKSGPVDEAHDSSQTGLRQGQAFNYAADQSDMKVQAALLGLTARANLKQVLLLPTVKRHKHYGDDAPPVPEAPEEAFDFLFMVEAVANALKPGRPARVLFERQPLSSVKKSSQIG